jgi:hypothetical protein
LPVLVSGGRPLRAENSEAAVMAGILKREFGIAGALAEEQAWIRPAMPGTRRNPAPGRDHARRAGHPGLPHAARPAVVRGGRAAGGAGAGSFRQQDGGGFAASDLLPGASALHHSYYALHEWLGIAWARLSGV